MLRIYDCSNSHESNHGKDFGPRENDIIKILKEYSRYFEAKFVNSMADVLITNDIFPTEVRNIDMPKIKRMDGIYWNNDQKHKNDELNLSAELSDHVIFISEYSRKALSVLYPKVKIKSSSVILNTADNRVFRPTRKRSGVMSSVIANCTNWNRKEKRFESLMQLAKLIPETLYLIGQCDMEVPPNVIKLGYIDDYERVNDALNKANAFINLSYRDAAPKVVCQAVAARLPVLYADSGGTKEIVDYGVPIRDEVEISFGDEIPELDPVDMLKSYNDLKASYNTYTGNVKRNHLAMVTNYYKILNQYGTREEILDKRI
jgi:glycosyltransferase involved in cell wall biosynthesis